MSLQRLDYLPFVKIGALLDLHNDNVAINIWDFDLILGPLNSVLILF